MDDRIRALFLKYFTIAQTLRLQGFDENTPEETIEFLMQNLYEALINAEYGNFLMPEKLYFNADWSLQLLETSLNHTVNTLGRFPKPHYVIEKISSDLEKARQAAYDEDSAERMERIREEQAKPKPSLEYHPPVTVRY